MPEACQGHAGVLSYAPTGGMIFMDAQDRQGLVDGGQEGVSARRADGALTLLKALQLSDSGGYRGARCEG